MPGLDELRAKYKWPDAKPDISFDDHGWFGWCHEALIDAILPKSTETIVELGSWLGKSTRFLLASAPRATVIAVDHWKGDTSILEGAEAEVLGKLPRLYDTFLSNCWESRSRLVPLKNTTEQGMIEIHEAGIRPEFIYLDAGHHYQDAKDDLDVVGRLFPSAILAGDDYGGKWQGLKQAVDEYAVAHGLEVCTVEHAWTLVQPKNANGIRIKLVYSGEERYKILNDRLAKEKADREEKEKADGIDNPVHLQRQPVPGEGDPKLPPESGP